MFMLYFYYVAYPHQLFIFLSMPHPTSLDSTNLSLFECQALPMNPLILLASAQNLVTTGTRTLLAERIFEHERPNEHDPQRINLHAPAPPMPPSNSTVSQDVQRPSSGTNFSLSQLDQLRELIAKAIGPQCSGSHEALGLLANIPLLSPASPTNSAAFNASQ